VDGQRMERQQTCDLRDFEHGEETASPHQP
jgi:hypothetical protein